MGTKRTTLSIAEKANQQSAKILELTERIEELQKREAMLVAAVKANNEQMRKVVAETWKWATASGDQVSSEVPDHIVELILQNTARD